MKRFFFLFAAMMLGIMLSAQTITQKGISYRYNGKNPKTPLSDVTIDCVTANNTVKSDSIGSFTLVFNKMKMGDRIGLVTVKKREMMVFNQHAIDEWSIRKEPLCLILCDANEFENQKQELINIGKREAQKKYDRQKAELERQLADNQIDRIRYEAKLDSAWQKLDRLHKHIEEYADLFARIDQSEIDTLAQQAMDMFNQGQVDEAVKLFEQGNYLEKLKADNRTIQQADQMIETAEHVKAKVEEEKEMHLNSLKAQIEAYKMQNEWEKAGNWLKELADELNTYESLFDYANFCYDQKNYSEAEIYFLKALPIIQQMAERVPQYYDRDLAQLYNDIAMLYRSAHRHRESETMYLEALRIRRQLANAEPQYEVDLAQTLNGFAILYSHIQRFSECETMYLESLEIYRRLAKNHPLKYTSDLTQTMNNLAIFYSDIDRLVESEAMYLEALEIRRQLEKTNPRIYKPKVAETLNNLATLYLQKREFMNGIAMAKESLEIRRQLAQVNPQAYNADVAQTLNNLGVLYRYAKRFSDSETCYLKALEIRQQLAINNPSTYEPDVAQTMNNLAVLYCITERDFESKEMYLKALMIQRQLASTNPQAYEPDLAMTLNNLAVVYKYLKFNNESESCYLEALEIRRRLAKNNPQAYKSDLASTLENLATLYKSTNRLLESESLYIEALEIWHQLVQKNPQAYSNEMARTLGNLSSQYIFMKKFFQSEQFAIEAISIDSTKQWINANLAASLLFQGRYAEAEGIYRQYKNDLKDTFLQDLTDFEAAGIIPEECKADVDCIRKMLTEE